MFVPELSHGELSGPRTEENDEVERLIQEACSSLQDAGLALYLFDWSCAVDNAAVGDSESRERQMQLDTQRTRELEPGIIETLRAEFKEERRKYFGGIVDMPGVFDSDDWEIRRRSYDLARRAMEREKWAREELPRSWSHRMPHMQARTFLYTFDVIQQCLIRLSKYPNAPTTTADAVVKFDSQFPNLRAVRNSAQHSEQRSIGERNYGRKIVLGDAPDWAGGAGAKAFIQSALIGDRYGETLEDGSYGEVAINVDSLVFTRDLLQEVIDGYTWDENGFERTYP